MNYLLSLTISSVAGYLLLNLLSNKKPIDLLQKIILSIAIGLGLSGQIVFYCLLLNKAYSATLIWGLHAALIAGLFFMQKKNTGTSRPAPVIARNKVTKQSQISAQGIASPFGFAMTSKNVWERPMLIGLGILLLLLVPFWREAHFYPFGGWDAWSCWNLKARFIFLGGEEWTKMFDPILWRSNNHYPFLLPLINAWGWGFFKEVNVLVPMYNAIAFSFLTAALLFASLYRLTRNRFAFVPSLIYFSLPVVVTLSISQYSDIVVAFYLLAALSCLMQAKNDNNPSWAAIGGLCVGLLSFTKTEGLVASAILIALAFPFLRGKNSKLFGPFAIAAAIALLPTIIFKLTMAPANAAFINGLTSTDAPSTFMRIQVTFMFLAVELISNKWNGLWILLAGGLILSGTKCIRDGRWLIPAALSIFLAVAFAYYYINTYFEIIWWLKTTLNRVLYTILPALVWWAFYSFWAPAKK